MGIYLLVVSVAQLVECVGAPIKINTCHRFKSCCWLPVDNYLLLNYNMKLQELLDKYKDKLWDWWYNELVIDNGAWESYKWIIIDWRVNDNPMSEFSLAELLFSTPFLSLLEWSKYEWYLYWIKQDDQWTVKNIYYDDRYHKMNLVLLNTDSERIEYIEKFTI